MMNGSAGGALNKNKYNKNNNNPSSQSKNNNDGAKEKVSLFFLLALIFLGFHLRSFFRVHDVIASHNMRDVEDVFAIPLRNNKNKNNKAPVVSLSPQQYDQQAKLFYDYHYERVHALANLSTVIVWDTRSDTRPFGPLWDHFDNHIYKANGKKEPNLKASPYIFWGSICEAALHFTKHREQFPDDPIPHVLFFRLNENWGGFSQAIPDKTALWIRDLVGNEWKKQGCQNATIFTYLDHPDTLVAITTQFQIFDHPKVHSLPLGVKSLGQAEFLLQRLKLHHDEPRTQLLMVNMKPRPMRQKAIDVVLHNFQSIGLKNTFGTGADSYEQYYREIQRSKFILSPGGLGFDCYRHWEALYMGTIPVLETLNRTDGWFRTFNELPVAWIDSYENLTPQFLEREYQRIISQATSYKYEKLTRQWWVQFIQSHVPLELRKGLYSGNDQP